jgi:hypothetical protein
MGLVDNKKSIFTTIGAYTSLQQSGTLPDPTNIFPSINNKKDIVPYLLDVLKVVVGSNALQDLTGQLFTKMVDAAEPQLKTIVKKQVVQYNSGQPLPAYFTAGISVPAKSVDVFGTLKTNPNSASGSMLYSSNPDSFNKKAYTAILNAGTDTSFGNLLINYNATTDSFVFKPNGASPSIGKWLGDFVDHTQIIDKKTFISNVMNAFYGSITKNQKKTVEQVYQELQVNKLIEQLVNDNDSFVISPEDYEALQQQAEQIVNGVVYYDMGCGIMAASLPLSGLSSLVTSISGSSDPFFVGNQVNATIDQSTTGTPVVAEANKQTVKDGFFQRLIKLISQMLANLVTLSPQIRALLAISSAFQNNGIPQIGNPLDDLKKSKIYLKCVIQDAMRMINKFIFQLVITFLMALLNPVIRKIIKEKVNQYVGILKSLTVGNVEI